MNSEELEQLRLSLLRFLDGNKTRFGSGQRLLLQQARSEGRPELTLGELEAELLYLEDAGFIQQTAKALSPENRNFRVIKAGRDYLAGATV